MLENSGRHVRPESFPERKNRSEALAEAEKIRAVSTFSTTFGGCWRSSSQPVAALFFVFRKRCAAMQRTRITRHDDD
jgi:hypothetical protein